MLKYNHQRKLTIQSIPLRSTSDGVVPSTCNTVSVYKHISLDSIGMPQPRNVSLLQIDDSFSVGGT